MSTRTIVCTLALTLLATLGACRSKPYADAGSTPGTSTAQDIMQASALVRDAQRLELAGDDKGAMAKYREAIVTYNDLPVAWNNLGRLLMKQTENLAAAEAFKNAAELSPTDPVSLHNLGTLWESLGYLDDASKWYDQALLRDENYLPSLRRYLLVAELQNKTDPIVSERLKRALLIEDNPWWINRFKRMHQKVDEMRAASVHDPVSR